MKTMLFNKMVETGIPEFKVIYKFRNAIDTIEYGPSDESGFMGEDDIAYVIDNMEQDIMNATSYDIDIVDGVAALILEFDADKVIEIPLEEGIKMIERQIKEEKVMNKNTKVVVSMVNGEVKVNGIKGKEYNVILDESFTETINGYKNTIRELNVQLTTITAERDHLKSRLDKAIAYYNANKGKFPAANLNVKINPIEQGKAQVSVQAKYFCEDCGREITVNAADYCKRNAAVFDNHIYCFKCQRKHARRAN
jgi:uncharacterized protein YfeS